MYQETRQINRTLSLGRRKVQTHSEHEGEVSFLKLTTIEVLLMSVICSQGIPVFFLWREQANERIQD